VECHLAGEIAGDPEDHHLIAIAGFGQSGPPR
jgi:hypothetical protein